MQKETYRPAFAPGNSPKSSPYISYGLSYLEACAVYVTETSHATSVHILASGTLSRDTYAVVKLTAALEHGTGKDAVAGFTEGVKSHSYYSDILKTLYVDSTTIGNPILPTKVPIVCIPTSLSAGEYTPNAGATNDETHHDHSFQHLSIGPRLIILDPELSRTTHERIWLSTGIRAVDPCVEAICSLKPASEGDETAERGLRKLLPGLLQTKEKPDEVKPRLQCQLGAVDAIAAALLRVPMSGSHGIGHQLSPLGVGHGVTSCMLLPAVCKFNARVNEKQQQKVLDILWSEPSIKAILGKRTLEQGKTDLGDALDAVLRDLGMPRSLGDFGFGRENLDGLGEESLSDRYCKTNAIPLERKKQLMEILKKVFD